MVHPHRRQRNVQQIAVPPRRQQRVNICGEDCRMRAGDTKADVPGRMLRHSTICMSENSESLTSPHSHDTHVPVEEPSTASQAVVITGTATLLVGVSLWCSTPL